MTGPELDRVPPNPPAADPVRVVAGALGFGLLLGVGCQAVVTWWVRRLIDGAPPTPTPDFNSPAATVLVAGTIGGILLAALATWFLLTPIRNVWRQGMLSIVAGFGSFALSVVVITLLPFYRLYGPPALLVLAGVAVLACTMLGLRLSRTRAA
ncbi:MAG: hypothetical protein HOP28_02215 [Gemmatimonadales bacterium]|nr:hypothetical protein [Gemmatimonadales bacterium]